MNADRALPALDRAALLLQLVPYIVGKGEVAIAAAAADFDVTADQMRAMVERLTVIGLPGEGGYWQLPNELFRRTFRNAIVGLIERATPSQRAVNGVSSPLRP